MSSTEALTTTANDLPAKLAFTQGDRLAKALSYAEMDGIQMADYLGMSRTTISNYLNGRTAPRLLVLRTWALRTGVPLNWILTGRFDDDKTPASVGGGLAYTSRDSNPEQIDYMSAGSPVTSLTDRIAA